MTFGKHLLAALTLLLTSQFAHAALIEYNGYSRDEASNIVTGGGLEWLKWDLTKGMSINAALSETSWGERWRLASKQEMANLFNEFSFGITWSNVEHIGQYTPVTYTSEYNQNINLFLEMFGYTYESFYISFADGSKTRITEGSIRESKVLFGSDENSNELFNGGALLNAVTYYNTTAKRWLNTTGQAALWGDGLTSSFSNDRFSVALVRSANANTNPTPVPLPGSLSLLALGLFGLAFKRRRKGTHP